MVLEDISPHGTLFVALALHSCGGTDCKSARPQVRAQLDRVFAQSNLEERLELASKHISRQAQQHEPL
jgi:hypothetical protein